MPHFLSGCYQFLSHNMFSLPLSSGHLGLWAQIHSCRYFQENPEGHLQSVYTVCSQFCLLSGCLKPWHPRLFASVPVPTCLMWIVENLPEMFVSLCTSASHPYQGPSHPGWGAVCFCSWQYMNCLPLLDPLWTSLVSSIGGNGFLPVFLLIPCVEILPYAVQKDCSLKSVGRRKMHRSLPGAGKMAQP